MCEKESAFDCLVKLNDNKNAWVFVIKDKTHNTIFAVSTELIRLINLECVMNKNRIDTLFFSNYEK